MEQDSSAQGVGPLLCGGTGLAAATLAMIPTATLYPSASHPPYRWRGYG